MAETTTDPVTGIPLRLCPFCGNAGQTTSEAGYFLVECTDCDARGPFGESPEIAAVEWNGRAGDDHD